MAKIVDRRTFLKTAAATTAATYAARSLPASAAAIDQARVAVTPPLSTFPYADVRLLDGPMKQQFEENHARFLNLADDRMLKVFRQVAGLPAPGEDMGGWYDLTGFSLDARRFSRLHRRPQFRAVCLWPWLALMRSPARSPRKRRSIRLVKGYAETLDPKAKFFVDYRLPAYTYDKLSCGLIDAHEFAHDPHGD